MFFWLALVAGAVHCSSTEAPNFAEKYLFEMLMVCGIAVLVFNFINGRSRNLGLVREFITRHSAFLFSHFTYAGPNLTNTDELQTPEQAMSVVEEDTAYYYRLYLTGRINTKFAILSLLTKRRQDLLISVVYSLLFPEKDRFYLELTLPDFSEPKGILYVVRTKQIKKLFEEFEDLKTMCKKFTVAGLTANNLSVFAENDEIVEALMKPGVVDVINECGAGIETIEISDCVQSEMGRGVSLKVQGHLGSSSDADRNGKILALGLKLADLYCEYNPSKKLVEKLTDNRTEFYSKKDKEKRETAAEELKNKKWEALSEKEKQKKIEKEEKRAKNRMGKQIMIVKK